MDGERFEKTGGLQCLAGGLIRIRHADNLPSYAAEVKEKYLLRRLTALFMTLEAKAKQAEADVTEIVTESEIRGAVAKGNRGLFQTGDCRSSPQ
jgi:replicative DNA helicase